MPKPEAPKQSFSQQLLFSALVLIVVAIVVAIFAKLVVGFIIFLLGVIAGIGSKYTQNNSL
ncbi:hypothetical protein EKI60_00675 [Candidatus Saccharibacteria bacterium]|nr:MAG: hypothetical protein EKI60_00675 [Candidatus Saccharibacteria bacterium]